MKWALALVLTGLLGAPLGAREAGRATKPTIEPKADKILHQMSDYVSGLKSFKLQGHSVDQVVLASGQKISVIHESDVSVLRPNSLSSKQLGEGGGLAFNDDGHQMTLYCKTNNTYATAPSPTGIDATIDEARKKFNIDAPGADLIYSNPYSVLTEQVTGGRYIGEETVGGLAAHHLAFQGKDVDWQIWIQDGDKPLPLRYEITSKTVKSQPTFTVVLTHWQPQANLTDADFRFQPPAGATRVEEFPTECRPGVK
jgi:hypothetical protein